jgi:hypothetical protein
MTARAWTRVRHDQCSSRCRSSLRGAEVELAAQHRYVVIWSGGTVHAEGIGEFPGSGPRRPTPDPARAQHALAQHMRDRSGVLGPGHARALRAEMRPPLCRPSTHYRPT